MDESKKRYGIVFCGGGAKGAYQIGVWRYLHELGLDQEITGVSGASIGALNSMLFVQGDYGAAWKTWMQARQDDITPINTGKVAIWAVETITRLRGAVKGVKRIRRLAKTGTVLSGMFSQEHLRTLMGVAVDETKLKAGLARIEAYTALTRLSLHVPNQEVSPNPAAPILGGTGKIEYWAWRGLTCEEIEETVLASASLPVIYAPKTQRTGIYVDGGVTDNIPIRPLVDAGFQNVIVVHLDHCTGKKRQAVELELERQARGMTELVHVWPSKKSLFGITGTVAISSELTEKRMELGYEDAKEQLFQL